METVTAFMIGQMNRGNQLKVFDWNKAAEIIRNSGTNHASAGLSGDWEWTGGMIFTDGKPVDPGDTYVYLASTWATPELNTGDGEEPCYIMEDEARERWGDVEFSSLYWPDSALKILNAG
jgi:hypothetical protein